VSADPDGREMARAMEEGADRFMRSATSFLARVGCLVTGSLGLTGACHALFGSPTFRRPLDPAGAGR
jgi:hypothetical protein